MHKYWCSWGLLIKIIKNNWSHNSLGLLDNINFVLVISGIFDAIDADTATWVVMYFNWSVLADSFGVLSNTDSNSNVAM